MFFVTLVPTLASDTPSTSCTEKALPTSWGAVLRSQSCGPLPVNTGIEENKRMLQKRWTGFRRFAQSSVSRAVMTHCTTPHQHVAFSSSRCCDQGCRGNSKKYPIHVVSLPAAHLCGKCKSPV